MLPSFRKAETPSKSTSILPRVTPSAGATRSDRVISIIGPDITIDGDLTSMGELRIDGEVVGNIRGILVSLRPRPNNESKSVRDGCSE